MALWNFWNDQETPEDIARHRIEEARREGTPRVDLTSLGLTSVPATLGELAEVYGVFLDYNKLTSVPETLGRLARLGDLSLSYNKLTSVPDTIGDLAQLGALDLSRNQLTSVPKTLGQLAQLHYLHLEGNQLTSVPDTLGQLTELKRLHLSSNQLTGVPEALGQLTQLQYLHLEDNRLTSLPETFEQLTNLEHLFLHGNDALGIPAEVLGPTYEDQMLRGIPAAPARYILNYYFSTHRPGGARPLNEAKMILVGWGAVGKTSLVERLVHGRFDDKQAKTEGIAITNWPLKLNGNEDIRLNVWDFGGQEIMHGTHQFFLSKRSLYLLVLNGRQGHEDADAEYWLTLIESFGPECPVLVVLNKIDEQPFDLNRGALQQKYPQIRGFVRTDCKTERGLGELKKAIEHETNQLHDLRAKFPASWFTIKEEIPKSAKNFMTFPEYRTFCSQNGEKDEAEQDKLADFLHCLGIALNFRDDPRLRSTHVLNPHWITKGIYTILNDKTLENEKGLFRDADLNRILAPLEFPREMHSYVTDLMKKFQQCFLFHDQEGQYLIPQLLPKEEPKAALEYKAEECLNFEYHYRIVPEGLLPRFIVRTHVMSKDAGRWRTGAILSFEGNTALVKADAHDRKVTIRVRGTKEGRRRLLAIIRSDFERIHADIRNLNPQEMVPVPGHPTIAFKYPDLCTMERDGVGKMPFVVDGKVFAQDIQELLNGVDLEGTRRKERDPMERSDQAIRLFYSYSHKDEPLRQELETHLKLLERRGLIAPWHEYMVGAGSEWKGQIHEHLNHADVILLLISADFLASDYCYDIEMKRAMERHESKEAQVIPVILRAVNWEAAPFGKLQALPKDAKAVTKWPDKDTAWQNVSAGIEKAVHELRKQRRQD